MAVDVDFAQSVPRWPGWCFISSGLRLLTDGPRWQAAACWPGPSALTQTPWSVQPVPVAVLVLPGIGQRGAFDANWDASPHCELLCLTGFLPGCTLSDQSITTAATSQVAGTYNVLPGLHDHRPRARHGMVLITVAHCSGPVWGWFNWRHAATRWKAPGANERMKDPRRPRRTAQLILRRRAVRPRPCRIFSPSNRR